jgi:hypothetical protein
MIASEIQVASPPATAPQAAAGHDHGFSFHDFLHAMNPLQYLPVVGTIYRAATGDVIPEPLRQGGSLLVSGLLGGPIGVATYIATAIAEKITGINPEKIVASQFRAAAGAKSSSVDPAETVAPASASLALTPAQLAAYGVRSDASGTLKLGDIEGADVLNAMELVRLDKVTAAYAANHASPFAVAAGAG